MARQVSDEAFSEFVHSAWPGLYRTAYLLVGDHGSELSGVLELFGAMREAGDFPVPQAERADLEPTLETIVAGLGPGATEAAMATGRALPLDDVVADALGERLSGQSAEPLAVSTGSLPMS